MSEIIVLGAGMVGVGTALALQARGHAVTLIDRRAPGQETSFGNAGVIQAEAMEPYAMPRAPLTLLHYALGRSNDVKIRWRDLPQFARPVLSYFMASTPRYHAEVSKVYARMIAQVRQDHGALIDAAGADHLIQRTGLGEIYRTDRALTPAIQDAQRKAETYGLSLRVLHGSRLRAEDTAIQGDIAGALIWDDSWSCIDPGALVQSYADLFQQRGGTVQQGDANNLHQTGNGWQVQTDGGLISAEHAVVALGPWSGVFVKRFGYKVPMVLKRGYHTHMTAPSAPIRPYLDAEHGYVLAPMRAGLRLTSGAELTGQNRPQRPDQLIHARHAVRGLIPDITDGDGTIWHGHRPCLPEMLPRIGKADNHPGLWFNFGHGHQGFTLGPTTGHILADLMDKG